MILNKHIELLVLPYCSTYVLCVSSEMYSSYIHFYLSRFVRVVYCTRVPLFRGADMALWHQSRRPVVLLGIESRYLGSSTLPRHCGHSAHVPHVRSVAMASVWSAADAGLTQPLVTAYFHSLESSTTSSTSSSTTPSVSTFDDSAEECDEHTQPVHSSCFHKRPN